MNDKYDEAIAYLTEHPDAIHTAWFSPRLHRAGCLFQFCTPDGAKGRRSDTLMCGCLTQVHGRGCNVAWTDELTEAIEQDNRLPACIDDVQVDDLPVFAEWQRRLDREIRGAT